MKTITEKSTNISIAVFKDARTVTVGSDSTVAEAMSDTHVTSNKKIYTTEKSSTHTLETAVTIPSDYKADKYKFDGTTWTLNTDYKIICESCHGADFVLNAYDSTKCYGCGESL